MSACCIVEGKVMLQENGFWMRIGNPANFAFYECRGEEAWLGKMFRLELRRVNMMLTRWQHTRSQIDPRKCAVELRTFRFEHAKIGFLDPSQRIRLGLRIPNVHRRVRAKHSTAPEIVETDVIDGGDGKSIG